jgi:hypothetical protein
MHQQLWGYKVEWKSVSRGTGEKKLNTTALNSLKIRCRRHLSSSYMILNCQQYGNVKFITVYDPIAYSSELL